MTVAVGINWLWEVVLAADTRVSWQSKGTVLRTEDVLKKLYAIPSRVNPRKTAILGFACDDLRAAKAVMLHLRTHKFPHYSRPLVMAHLKDDLRRWIEEVTINDLSPEMRKGLSFMLCGLEPSRPSTVKKNGQVIGKTRMPRAHLYVYKVSQKTGRVAVQRKSYIAVIGTGHKLEREIAESSRRFIGFGGINQMQWARAHIIAEIVSLICQRGELEDVGGPFQAVCITPAGVIAHFV